MHPFRHISRCIHPGKKRAEPVRTDQHRGIIIRWIPGLYERSEGNENLKFWRDPF